MRYCKKGNDKDYNKNKNINNKKRKKWTRQVMLSDWALAAS